MGDGEEAGGLGRSGLIGMLPTSKKKCKHDRCICCDCQNCYYCHHKAVFIDDKWYWKCPDGRIKLAGLDMKYNG